MKIAIISNNSNGLYLFRRQLISTLINSGHEVYILTPFDSDVERLKSLGVRLFETPLDRRGKNFFKDLTLIKLYNTILKKIRPDIVLTYTIKPNIYGGIVSKRLKILYCANVTGIGTAFQQDGILKKFVTILNRFALANAKTVFFENSCNRDAFVENKIVKLSKTCVLSGAGVDLSYFNYQEYPNNDVFKFLFIGRIMKEKGIEELLESMRRLVKDGEKCTLDVVGALEEDYGDELKRFELEGWLKYHGFQEDVRPFIGKCDCFVLPSYHEGMANTNLECAASGRPIITSNIPGCREAVIENVTGILCEAKEADSLYEAMKLMIRTPLKKRELMGKEGRYYMFERFDKNAVINETIKQIIL